MGTFLIVKRDASFFYVIYNILGIYTADYALESGKR